MNAWPHQIEGVRKTLAAIDEGLCRIALTAPTGCGKSWMMASLAKHYLDQQKRVTIYTNRRLLLEQSSRVFGGFDLDHGIIASGMTNESYKPFQIASIQTVTSRMKNGGYGLPESHLVLVDELHVNAAEKMQDIMTLHIDSGAAVVGVTATPIDIGHVADTLIVACNNSEGRRCGALVPARMYGIEEPDLRRLLPSGILKGDGYIDRILHKMSWTPRIVGRVIENYRRLNPEEKPTILFASGVSESLFFAEQFTAAGHRAAHIDGENIWIDGESYPTTPDLRQQVLDESRDGRIRVVCNRFVLREGIDAPWLSHGIFATVYGSLQSYLQSGGRILRSYRSGRDGDGDAGHVTVQDHGGNWWRHGDLNADREWYLDFGASQYAALRDDRLRDGSEPEPFRCPACALIVTTKRCECGYEFRSNRRSRPVMQLDGSLIEMTGSVVKQQRTYEKPDGPTKWQQMYHRSITEKGKRTFRAAAALFAYENAWSYPRRDWAFMPKRPLDWYRLCSSVPREDLI